MFVAATTSNLNFSVLLFFWLLVRIFFLSSLTTLNLELRQQDMLPALVSAQVFLGWDFSL
jgi:hypothetical protein